MTMTMTRYVIQHAFSANVPTTVITRWSHCLAIFVYGQLDS